jgi:diadenosine tetraphosphatase ApaH/serine/threonine PP2A family protein phosphatase
MPDNWTYILDVDGARDNFKEFSQSVCLIGHTHVPACFILQNGETIIQQAKESINLAENNKYIINIGSVGQPRDNDPRACYLVVDTDTAKLYYRRVEYDIGKTQEKMKKAKLPEFLIERIAIGV